MGASRHRTLPTPLLLRRRLLQRLAGSWKIALLDAPAGYGKSTLAAQYAAGRSALWCRLSRDDRDLSHLLGRLIGAGLRADAPLTVRTERLFRARRDLERDGGLLTTSLLAEITPGRGSRLLVLEDLHVVAGSREVLGWLRRVIEESGPGLRFLITSRSPCPLPMARLELHLEVVRLGPEELEFDEREQAAFLRQTGAAALDPAAVSALQTSMRGWPAGFVLASIGASPRRPPEVANAAVEERTTRLFRYLAEEVFQPLPAELRSALCCASLLEELDDGQLDLVLGERAGARLRAEMARRELFIRPSGGGKGVAVFHPLFREFLREQFPAQISAAEGRRVGRRFAKHLLAVGESLRAVRVLLDTGNHEPAVRAFERCAAGAKTAMPPAALSQTAVELLRHPLARTAASRSPWVLFHAGVAAYREGRPAEGAESIAEAQDRWLASREYARIAGSARAAVACAWTTGRHAPLISRLRGYLARIPAREGRTRAILLAELGGMELIAGQPKLARRDLAAAERVLRGTPDELPLLEIRLNRANIHFSEGRWDRYLTVAQSALAAFRRLDLPGRQQALLVNMAEAMIYLGEEDRALATLEEATGLQSRVTLGNAPLIALGRARALVEKGAVGEAARALDEARELARRHSSLLWEHQVDLWTGVLRRRQGKWEAARSALVAAVEGMRRIDSPSWSNVAEMELALVLGVLGRDEALPRLTHAAAVSRRLGDPKEIARNLLYQARVRQAAGDDPTPLLRRGLRMLERQRYLVLLRKEADLTKPLLPAASGLPVGLRRLVESALPVPAAAAAARPATRPATRPSTRPSTRLRVRPVPAVAPLSIRLLGGFEITLRKEAISLPRRASMRLLARLALRPGVPLRREELAEDLWPGASAAQSRNRFDVALNAARRAVEPDAGPRGPFRILESAEGWCRLAPDMVRVDVPEFEAAVRRCEVHMRGIPDSHPGRQGDAARRTAARGARRAVADLTAALKLYRGEVLPDLADAEWIHREREHWREQSVRLRLARAEWELRVGRADAAAADARTVLEGDPLEERAIRLLMRALLASGEHSEAVRACRRFATRMRRELAVPPGPETVELFRIATDALRRRRGLTDPASTP